MSRDAACLPVHAQFIPGSIRTLHFSSFWVSIILFYLIGWVRAYITRHRGCSNPTPHTEAGWSKRPHPNQAVQAGDMWSPLPGCARCSLADANVTLDHPAHKWYSPLENAKHRLHALEHQT